MRSWLGERLLTVTLLHAPRASHSQGFNSTVQLLATTDNPSALPLAMRLQSA